jgi:hypothetical protein
VHRREALRAFELDQQRALDQKIGAESPIDDEVAEPDPDRLLPLHGKPVPGEALRKHGLIDRLKQTRPKPLMNLEPAIHSDGRKALDIRAAPSRLCVFA